MQPGSFAVVMATGIVSVGAAEAGRPVLSWSLFALGAAAFLALAALAAVRGSDVRRVEALTFAAGSGVLGARLALAGDLRAALGLGALAGAAWAALAVPAALDLLRRESARRSGSALLAVVAPESLAVLGGILGRRLHAAPLTLAGEALWALGLLAYVALAPGVARRLARGGFAPDDWIAMGAAAIATVAAGELGLAPPAVALWGVATAWLPLVGLAELRRGARRYESRRWATVFPLGMYAVATWEAGAVDRIAPLADVALAAFWIAFAVWCATVVAMVRR